MLYVFVNPSERPLPWHLLWFFFFCIGGNKQCFLGLAVLLQSSSANDDLTRVYSLPHLFGQFVMRLFIGPSFDWGRCHADNEILHKLGTGQRSTLRDNHTGWPSGRSRACWEVEYIEVCVYETSDCLVYAARRWLMAHEALVRFLATVGSTVTYLNRNVTWILTRLVAQCWEVHNPI